MYSISARVKVGWVGRVDSSSVVLVAEVFEGVKRHGGEGGRSLTLMSLPCFVRIVPSTLFRDWLPGILTVRLLVTLAGYYVHSTLVPAVVPKTFFAPSEKIHIKKLFLSNGRGCAGKRGKRGT